MGTLLGVHPIVPCGFPASDVSFGGGRCPWRFRVGFTIWSLQVATYLSASASGCGDTTLETRHNELERKNQQGFPPKFVKVFP